jgi:hypothetical protein
MTQRPGQLRDIPIACRFCALDTSDSLGYWVGVQTILTIGIRLLETLFVIGVIGSTLVLVLTTIDDVRELFEKEPRHDKAEL